MNESVERVGDCLASLVKAALVSDDRLSLDFRNAARRGLRALAEDPPEADTVRVDGAWTLAIQAAETPEMIPEEGRVSLTLQRSCPFTLAELTDPALDVDAAVERIRRSASTG